MSTRTTLMLLVTFAVICAVVAILATAVGTGIRVALTPREEDGSQVAVDFVQDLIKGRMESAWERTSVAYREDHDYAVLAQQAKTHFGKYIQVTIQAGDAGDIVTGRIDYEGRPSGTFRVGVVNEDGFWRVSKVSFGQ